MISPLDIFNFSDYRIYLKNWLDQARSKGQSNLSRVAAQVGVHTSFLSHVLSGVKNLSFEQAAELSDALSHTSLEQEYFFTLIQIDRAGSQKLKKYWLEKKQAILNERTKVKSRMGEYSELSSEERAVFYSSWIYVAVFVATAINDGQTLDQITELFKLTRAKAEEILTFLIATGICSQVGPVYKMGKSVVYLNNDSPLVVKHHTNWRLQALQKMDKRDASELFFTSPMSLSQSDFEKIRELLSQCIESSMEICRHSPAEEVVCLNIDFFKVG